MHRPGELFSLERTAGSGWLARLDVRTQLIVSLSAIAAVVASARPWLPLAVFACCAVLWIVARVPLVAGLGRLAGPLGLAAVVCLLRALLTGTTPLAHFDLGPWRLTVTREGLAAGALVGSRVLGSVSVFILLCSITSAGQLFSALGWARLPRTWVEIAMLMHRYILILRAQVVAVIAAQRVRLGYGNFGRSMTSMANLAGLVMLRSMDQAEKSHEAMVARGFSGSFPVPPLPAMPRRQRWITGAGVALVAAAFLLTQWGLP
jgi:cobalt/nickel transport system permease protein